MYVKLDQLEIMGTHLEEVRVGDILSFEALIRNPLDWDHFFERIEMLKDHRNSQFVVVTREGDRIEGFGEIISTEKWRNGMQFGFKIKVKVKKQKSLSDKRAHERPQVADQAAIAELSPMPF
jgi:hypothetical protein